MSAIKKKNRYGLVDPVNPEVCALMRNFNGKRQIILSRLRKVDGKCYWCMGDKSSNRKKYCDDDCRISANAYFYPQQNGRDYILESQDNKCNVCEFDFTTKELWKHYEDGNGLEIDHITPIHDGGESFNWDNLQGLCKPCHLKKTGKENRERKSRSYID